MVIETEVNFEKKGKGKILLHLYMQTVSPGDKVRVILNGDKIGTYSSGQEITLDPGDKINLKPVSGEGSYFSYFEGMNPPKVLTSDEAVVAYFREND